MYAYEAVWQVQSGHPVFSGGPAGNRGKSSVADYGKMCIRDSYLADNWSAKPYLLLSAV